ncbi:F-box/WD40 repeat-containing protein [Endozoicomonas sp. GU-1]|uniref:F-box/WD repeat-containing protein n=1 Tax=Endozoicomonas sp. GU-1 TaxID=3009078 RepID=UPI0022B388ED|nr:F-box/WD40 repeat-containing protein [Endozoicomonas sp. GU-1]WBA82233.1 F-box/WD40 repeat-containing protein [Endozoicomonas sp. GU-1]WBA85170.1 F-box/WD40 repeat-containing protein [Endozoicomonas sp. GU-1]
MSDPLSPRAVGVPDWPANEPAKTTPPSSPRAIELPAASPQTQFPQQQPLWQRTITELPRELLAIIFDHLEFDDIRQVNATCLAFRDVVKEYKYIQELSYFARLPQRFREQYRQTAPWQKKSHCFHPFATPASRNNRGTSFRDRIIKNLPQMSALLCLDTLRRMESCPAYRLVPRHRVTLPQRNPSERYSRIEARIDFCLSQSSRHLLFYGRFLHDSRILTRDDRGQWAEEHVNWSGNSGSRVITAANFSACTNRLLTRSREGYVNTLRSANSGWEEVGKKILPNQKVQFSPSGKYMVTCNEDHQVRLWCMDENNNDWLKMKVSGLSPERLTGEVQFSPSERYLSLHTRDKRTILSLDDCGVWSAQHSILFRGEGFGWSYDRFSPVADQLLVCIDRKPYKPYNPGRVAIHSPDPSGKWQETVIFPTYFPLKFSSTGKYLFAISDKIGGPTPCEDLLLWHRPENWSDWSLNPCLSPELSSASRLESAIRLKHDGAVRQARFSPSDSHLLTTSYIGGVGTICIWEKSQAGTWSIQTITRKYSPIITGFSLSGLHALIHTSHMVGILGLNDQKHWSLKGEIEQDGIINARFNPMSEHEVLVLSYTGEGDMTNFTLQVWEIRDADTSD